MSDEPFLGFSPQKTLTTMMQDAYIEFVCMDENLEITGEQTDKKLCANVVQSMDFDVKNVEEINNDPFPPNNKAVVNALNLIHQQLMYQGGDMNRIDS